MTSPRDIQRGRARLPAGAVLVGKYRIERVLGEGGMGVVYAAHHILLDRPVALKLLAPDAALNPEARGRFLNEARNAARVDNDYVCRVMDLGVTPEGQPYIAMELLEGIDLGRLLESRQRLPVVEAVGYVIQALTGIGTAHLMGVVHRDLKPSNLFLANKAGGGQLVKVLDFGISKATSGGGDKRAQQMTSMGNLIGSPAYMSPEQVNLAPNIDGRADLWAVGVILYQLLTGTLPFASPNVAEVLAYILEKDPAPLAGSRPDVPPGLDAVIARCLAKDPARRFPSAADLAAALGPFGPWASTGGRPDASRVSLSDAPDGSLRGTSAPAGFSTDKKPADARSPYLRMIGLGAGIGAALLAVLVVVASRPGAPAATAAKPPASAPTAALPSAAPVTTAAPSAAPAAAPEPSATAEASSATPPAPIATATTGVPTRPGAPRKSALTRQRN